MGSFFVAVGFFLGRSRIFLRNNWTLLFFFPLPQGQLSILQEKIDHLERLLAENNEIISNIRDSVINLSESVKDGQKNPEAINFSQGSVSEMFPSASALLAVDSEDCLFALKSGSHSPGVQVSSVPFSLILLEF